MWCLQPEHKLLVCSREFASVTWMATFGFPGCFYMNFEYFYICLLLWLQLWISKFHCWFSFLKYFCLIWMKLLFFYLVSVLCPMSAWEVMDTNSHLLITCYLFVVSCTRCTLSIPPLSLLLFLLLFFFFWDSLTLWPSLLWKSCSLDRSLAHGSPGSLLSA